MRPKDFDGAAGRHDTTVRDDAGPPTLERAEGRQEPTMRSEELADISATLGRIPHPVEIVPGPGAMPRFDSTLRSPNEEDGPRTKVGGPSGTAIMGTAPAQIQALNRELAGMPPPPTTVGPASSAATPSPGAPIASHPMISPPVHSPPAFRPMVSPTSARATSSSALWIVLLVAGVVLLVVGVGVVLVFVRR